MKGYPCGFMAFFWAVLGMLIISGFALIPWTLTMKMNIDIALQLPSDLRRLMVVLHGITAFLMVGVLGALLPIHMRSGLRRPSNLISGLLLSGLFGVLLLSALGIYYLGGEISSLWASIIHLIAGLVLLIPLPMHVMRKKRTAPQSPNSLSRSTS